MRFDMEVAMEVRYSTSPKDVKRYTTEELREEFLLDGLFEKDKMHMVYSHVDRMITGAAVPVEKVLEISDGAELHSEYFLDRREMGVINIGGDGIVTVDGTSYSMNHKEGMYIGMGTKKVSFSSKDKKTPAKFYINSTPAHKTYPTVLIKPEGEKEDDVVIIKEENKVELGSMEASNHRTICKYILPGQVESCQLVMGMTSLKPGSVWNSMPCHTHNRRMEVYLYFELEPEDYVMHYMGEPTETRHIVMRNEQAVISPSWSIHAGSGTRCYTFIWGMAGENQAFDDMDNVKNSELM
jgi:4-deoxy-L-threo-5-hexosulose-uronate ketol-isomerase